MAKWSTRGRCSRPVQYVWDIGDPCAPPGQVSFLGATANDWIVKPLLNWGREANRYRALSWFKYGMHYIATLGDATTPPHVLIELCDRLGHQKAFNLGKVLIDPDGYVYDVDVGIDGRIQNATVTCDEYDEDMQSWSRWPAEIYENQINPQITGEDGYYAFFVPPGLYRVRAQASGYESHTSPNIRVISEIVHYNVPLQGGEGTGALFLPALVK